MPAILLIARYLAAQRDRPFAAAQGDTSEVSIGGFWWESVGGVCCPWIERTAMNGDTLPSPAGDHEGHPYGLSGLLPLFMLVLGHG
jgi:hypothetical protein